MVEVKRGGAAKRRTSRVYGGRTHDQRNSQRRATLIDAAFGLVADEGWRGLNIEAVCRRARLNKRYFYETFDGLDALIGAVTARLADDAIAVTLAALDPDAPLDEVTRPAIIAFVFHLTDDPRRARVLFGAVPVGDAAAGHQAAAIRQLIATAGAHGRAIYAVPEGPAVELAAAMLVGGTSQALLDWLEGRVDCSREQLAEYLVGLWQAIGDAATARGWEGERPEPQSSAGAAEPRP